MALANASWLIAGRLAADALSLVLFGVIAREYGPGGVGVYSAYFAIATILYDIVALGIDDYGVREYARAGDAERKLLLQKLLAIQLVVAASGVALVILYVLSTSISREHFITLIFLITFQVSNALARTFLIPSIVSGSMSNATLASVSGRLGIALTAFIAARSEQASLLVALSGFPIFGVLTLTYIIYSCRNTIEFHGLFRRRGDEWQTLRLLFPFAAAAALSSVVVRIPMLVLFVVAGDVLSGLYATAFKLTELGQVMIFWVPFAAYAELARSASAGEQRFHHQVDRVLRITLVFGGVISWGMYAVAPVLLVPLLGEKVAAAAPLLELMALYLLVQPVGAYLLRLMFVFGLQSVRVKILAFQAIFTLALCAALAPSFGAHGTIAALVAGEALTTSLHYAYLRKHLHRTLFVHRVFSFGVVVLVTGATNAALSMTWDAGYVPEVISLTIFIVGCLISGLLHRDLLAEHAIAP